MNTAKQPGPTITFDQTRIFREWQAEMGCTLVLSVGHPGVLVSQGFSKNGEYATGYLKFGDCGALGADHQGNLWVATSAQIWKFDDVLRRSSRSGKFQRVLVPRMSFTTASLQATDLQVLQDGTPLVASRRFSCLVVPSPSASFRPLWKPGFVSSIVPQDRCGLSGFAIRDGNPAFVSVWGSTDEPEGWRSTMLVGGAIIDIKTGDRVATGFCLPHAPRWHQGALFALDSGRGHLVKVDVSKGKFEPVCLCPGFPTSLFLVGGYAVVGFSATWNGKPLSGLPLVEALEKRKVRPLTGVAVVDLKNGDILHIENFTSGQTRVAGMAVLEQCQGIGMCGLKPSSLDKLVTLEPPR